LPAGALAQAGRLTPVAHSLIILYSKLFSPDGFYINKLPYSLDSQFPAET
jgi:hypothetical protein